MERAKIDIWVGLFVLIGAAAILFLALQSANLLTLSFQDTYRVVGKFDNIGGLKRQAAVRSAGVVVGRVTNVALDKQMFQAVVTVSVEKEYEFPTDTLARILTSGILGDQYISLEPGGEMDNMKDGDTIENTSDAFVLEKLISKFIFSATSGENGETQDDEE